MLPDLTQYMWIAWLVLAILFVIVELLTLEFTFLMLAAGTLIGGLGVNLLGGVWWLQILAAAAISALLLFTIRPLLLRALHRSSALQPTVEAMRQRGTPFAGLLYAGLALTSRGLRVVEFNARFGDPETQVVLARLTSPLSQLLMAAASGHLEDEPAPSFADTAAITVVFASEGYPESPVTGRLIDGTDTAASVPGVHLAHAATAERDGVLIATGGRVINVAATGPTFGAAREHAYAALRRIALEGSHYRTDIAARVAAG